MDEHELLVRHARAWAETKSRDLDEELLRQVLSLRGNYEALPYGTWPAGSGEQLLLTTWPAYGDELPELDALQATLDTFWSFLRATGRMSAQSASPAELRKEAKRSLPKMAAAYDDPARHSLDRSPELGRGTAFSALANDHLDGVPELSRTDPKLTAQDARDSDYVKQCLELAEWVGDGKQATSRGVLRPAVAREAYQHLDLWPWDREHDRVVFGREMETKNPEADAVLARTALESWRSAGDCLALDRLWFSLDQAGLVERRGARMVNADTMPDTDEEWVTTTLTLLAGLCQRLGSYIHEPLTDMLLIPHVNDGSAPLDEIRSWWANRCPESLRDFAALGWDGRVDSALFHFADCNLWKVYDDQLTLTHLGNDFAVVYLDLLDKGVLED